jgi:diguanylate cyclase (GGDEF)-like protein/PAS domain S-box-containing protein
MSVRLTALESTALYDILAESTTDIVLKTDRKGFIEQASPALEDLGFLLPSMLIGPHLLDLVHPSAAAAVKAEHAAAANGRRTRKWIEFPAIKQAGKEQWYEIQMRGLSNGQGRIYGVLSIMRSIDDRRCLKEKLFAAAMTDPLTGLTNRPAFVSMLQHLVASRTGGCLALFNIDYFRAINMQYGQSVGDEVLVVFAELLKTLMGSKDIISRIGGETLAVLLPRATPCRAEAKCRRITGALDEIRRTVGPKSLAITASAGISPIAESLDDTIRKAELALFFAKANGRNCLEVDNGPRQGAARYPETTRIGN